MAVYGHVILNRKFHLLVECNIPSLIKIFLPLHLFYVLLHVQGMKRKILQIKVLQIMMLSRAVVSFLLKLIVCKWLLIYPLSGSTLHLTSKIVWQFRQSKKCGIVK
jgi:hypothetical protein